MSLLGGKVDSKIVTPNFKDMTTRSSEGCKSFKRAVLCNIYSTCTVSDMPWTRGQVKRGSVKVERIERGTQRRASLRPTMRTNATDNPLKAGLDGEKKGPLENTKRAQSAQAAQSGAGGATPSTEPPGSRLPAGRWVRGGGVVRSPRAEGRRKVAAASLTTRLLARTRVH